MKSILSLLIVGSVFIASRGYSDAETEQFVANDRNFVVEIAKDGGPSVPNLVPQQGSGDGDGIRLAGVYFSTPKRYVWKRAHLSRYDHRVFDADTGLPVYASSHLGKNPYGSLDPLDFADGDDLFGAATGGEWESACDVSGVQDTYVSFRIRPKTLSRHGRQYVRLAKQGEEHGEDYVVMNVAKRSKLKTFSVRTHFEVARGADSKDVVYRCGVDVAGRTISITNERDELIAQVQKTKKEILKTAIFGSESESVIDVAPGVDCSTMLAVVYAIGQVGKHFLGDVFTNFVKDPLKGRIVDGAIDCATGDAEIGDVCNTFDGNVDDVVDLATEEMGEFVESAAEEIGEILDAAEVVSSAIGDNLEEIGEFIVSIFFG